MADKLMYIPNDDTRNYLFCRLQLVIETFAHSTKWLNNQNSIKVPQSCLANDIIKLCGYV